MTCDLHTHSIYSDGSFSPAALIHSAKDLGLVIALTDHNTVSGLEEFMSEARKHHVTVIAGIEFSTVHETQELHLVGLFVDPKHYSHIEQVVQKYHVLKEISNEELAARLSKAGYRIDYPSIKRRSSNGNVNRVHVAKELMEKGYVRSVDKAFDALLHEDQGFYVPSPKLSTIEAIGLLRQIRAVPVLAHPLKELKAAQLRQILPELIEAGLAAMETRHSSHDDETIALAEQIAREYRLLPSGGSDFHGIRKPGINLGSGKGNLTIPMSVYEQLLTFRQSMT